MSSDPIFIIGTERSGSNLLRLILTAHSRIVIPHPPHFMNYFGHLVYSGSWEAKQRKMIQDMLRLVRWHIFPWDEYRLSEEAILKNIRHDSTFGIVAAIYETVLAQSGKGIWGCKSTFMIEHIDSVLEVYPGARFVFLVRDPRDVAVSAKKSVFSPCHPYLSASLWGSQQRIGLDTMHRFSEQFFLMRYETLLQDSETSLRSLCSFLDVQWEDSLLTFFTRDEAQQSSSLSASWRKTNQAIQSTNFNKWKTTLTPREVELVETACWKAMQELGYHPSIEQPAVISQWDRQMIRLKEIRYQIGIEKKSLLEDKNVWLRWRRDLYVKGLALKSGWFS